MSKKLLEKEIEKKLDLLNEKLKAVEFINSDDPEQWDSDYFYNLTEALKDALTLLEDKESKKEKDEFGNPVILEAGICSLVDDYKADEDDDK